MRLVLEGKMEDVLFNAELRRYMEPKLIWGTTSPNSNPWDPALNCVMFYLWGESVEWWWWGSGMSLWLFLAWFIFDFHQCYQQLEIWLGFGSTCICFASSCTSLRGLWAVSVRVGCWDLMFLWWCLLKNRVGVLLVCLDAGCKFGVIDRFVGIGFRI